MDTMNVSSFYYWDSRGLTYSEITLRPMRDQPDVAHALQKGRRFPHPTNHALLGLPFRCRSSFASFSLANMLSSKA